MKKADIKFLLKSFFTFYGALSLICIALFIWANWFSDASTDYIWQRILLAIFGDKLLGFKSITFLVLAAMFLLFGYIDRGLKEK
jgi:hypothetical protein